MTDIIDVSSEPGGGGLSRHYKEMLAGRDRQVLESADGNRIPDLSESGIHDRLHESGSQLHQIVRDLLGDKPELHHLADQVIHNGDLVLRLVRDEDDEQLRQQPGLLKDLETIVRTDGSRPSFMIQEGRVNFSSSPAGIWAGKITAIGQELANAIACVGRIDVPLFRQGFAGTGFLVQDNLILTNRHVLQTIGHERNDGNWVLDPSVSIDFGHEFRGASSISPRKLKRVVFSGASPIDLHALNVDHRKLDLALIELEPAPGSVHPVKLFQLDKTHEWATPDAEVYTIGYAGAPPVNSPFSPTLLELLFRSTYGCKRLAPGLVMPPGALPRTTMAHDATTLGGNSGSLIVLGGRPHLVAGLHYGGRPDEPRANFAHILGKVLDQQDGHSSKTLSEHLVELGVRLVDPLPQSSSDSLPH